MVLRPNQRQKLDSNDDHFFYLVPRFVTHVDEGFIRDLTDLYRERLTSGMVILDLMSSWVSHLPSEIQFDYVEGLGLNKEELAKNSRLNHYVVQNLNTLPKLPYPDNYFDAVLNCVSVQYLEYPEAIFNEIYRVLKSPGIAIISFSNRMFFEKAIAVWRDGSEDARVDLVKSYFESTRGFSPPEVIKRFSNSGGIFQWFGVTANDPFYAVISCKSE